MPVPILLVTGFLGAGKTTLVNHVLAHAEGRRIAAVVNDFGAINIDAELILGAADGVVSLANGCICCSLEGDLLRTLATILRRVPTPDAILIETSGVADPGDIVRNLMDPVIWREAPLETVLCVMDATASGSPDDALLRAQLRASDIVALSKVDVAGAEARGRARTLLSTINPRAVVIEATHGRVPLALLFPAEPGASAVARDIPRSLPVADRFEAMSWTSDRPLSLPRFQAAIESLAPRLARAKGILRAAGHPGRPLLFQFASGRAIVSQAGPHPSDVPPTRIVFIAEIGAVSTAEIDRVMGGCIAS